MTGDRESDSDFEPLSDRDLEEYEESLGEGAPGEEAPAPKRRRFSPTQAFVLGVVGVLLLIVFGPSRCDLGCSGPRGLFRLVVADHDRVAGLQRGDDVTYRGMEIGQVRRIDLDGKETVVTFLLHRGHERLLRIDSELVVSRSCGGGREVVLEDLGTGRTAPEGHRFRLGPEPSEGEPVGWWGPFVLGVIVALAGILLIKVLRELLR